MIETLEAETERKEDQLKNFEQLLEARDKRIDELINELDKKRDSVSSSPSLTKRPSSPMLLDPSASKDQDKRNAELQQKIKQLMQEVADLKEEVDRAGRERGKKESENMQLRAKINDYESGIDGMKKAQMEITYLKEQLAMRNNELTRYKEMYVKAMNDNQVLAEFIRIIMSRYNAKEPTPQEMEKYRTEQYALLQKEIERLQQMTVKLEADIEEWKKKAEKNANELAAAGKKKDAEIAEIKRNNKTIQDNLESTISMLKEKLATTETEVSSLQKELGRLKPKLAERETKVTELEALIKRLRSQADDNVANLKGLGEISKLQQQLDEAKDEINSLKSKLKSDRSTEVRDLMRTLELRDKKIEELETKIRNLEREGQLLDSLHDEYDRKNQTIKQRELELLNLRTEVKTLRATNESQKEMIDSYREHINGLGDIQHQLDTALYKLNNAQHDVTSARLAVTGRDATIAQLRKELEEADSLRDRMMTTLNEDLRRSTEQYKGPKEHHHVSTFELKAVEDQLARMSERFNDEHEEVIKLRNKLLKSENLVEDLKKDMEKLEATEQQVSAKEAEVVELRGMVKKLMDKDRELSKEESDSNERFNENMRRTLETFQVLIDQKDKTIHRFEQQLEEVRQQHLKDRKAAQEEVSKLNKKLLSKTNDVVTNMRQTINDIENQPAPTAVAPPGIPVEKVEEMMAQKAKEIIEISEQMTAVQIQLQKRIQELEQNIAANGKQFTHHLKEEQERYEKAREDFEARVADYEILVQNLRHEIQSIRGELLKKDDDLRKSLHHNQSLTASMTSTKTPTKPKPKKDKRDVLIADLEKKKTSLEETIEKLTQNLIKSEQALAIRDKHFTEEDDARVVKMVQEKTSELQKDAKKAQSEVRAAKTELEVLKVAEEALKNEVEQLKKDVEAKSANIERQVVTIKRLTKQKEKAIAELELMKKGSISIAGFDALKANAKIEELEKRIKVLTVNQTGFNLKKEHDKLLKEKTEAEAKRLEMKRIIDRLSKELEDAEAKAKHEKDELKATFEKNESEIRYEYERVLQELRVLQNEQTEWREEEIRTAAKMRESSDQLKLAKTQQLKIQKEKEKLDERGKMDHERKLRQQIEELKATIDERNTAASNFRQQIEQQRVLIEQLEKEKVQVTENTKVFQRVQGKSENKGMLIDFEKLKDIKQLKAKIHDLESQNAQLQRIVSVEKEQVILDLENQISKMKNKNH
jgi:chromosome segregation ATPase